MFRTSNELLSEKIVETHENFIFLSNLAPKNTGHKLQKVKIYCRNVWRMMLQFIMA
jgi:hypothetical protein